jgi:hypothetical protein
MGVIPAQAGIRIALPKLLLRRNNRKPRCQALTEAVVALTITLMLPSSPIPLRRNKNDPATVRQQSKGRESPCCLILIQI